MLRVSCVSQCPYLDPARFSSPNLYFLENQLTMHSHSPSIPGDDLPSCPGEGELGEHSLKFWVRAQASDMPIF